MPFHFFTDSDLLNAQVANEEFGPLAPSNGFDRFHVTSIHSSSPNSSTPNAKVYAVCDGEVVITDDVNNAGLVNIILKPSETPGVNLPRVKYFIYRGVLKSTLIDTNNGTIVPNTSSDSNDLTRAIWESQTALNNSAGTTNPAPSTAIDAFVDNTLPDPNDTPLNRSFYKNNPALSQTQPVNGGWTMGKFDAQFGFEIIADVSGFEPTLGLAKLVDNVVSVSTLAQQPAQSAFFTHWNAKESVLNYLDVCAFYGSFHETNILVRNSQNTNVAQKDGQEFFEDVLFPLFTNRNKVYIDIRNELNYSFDYYRSYADIIKIAFTTTNNPDPFIPFDYYRLNWPIFVLDQTEFPPGSSGTNLLRMSFPKGDNPNPVAFVSQGKLKTKLIKRDFLGRKDYDFLEFPLNGNYTKDITLTSPNSTNSSSPGPISTYIRIKYISTSPQCPPAPTPAPDTKIRGLFDLDNIFTPATMTLPWDGAVPSIQSNVFYDEIFVEAARTSGLCFMASRGYAKEIIDAQNINHYFFAFAEEKIIDQKKSKSFPISLVGEYDDVANVTFLEKIATKFDWQKKSVVIINNPVPGQTVESFVDIPSNTVSGFKKHNPNEFVFVKLDDSQYNAIIAIINGTHPTIPSNFVPGFNVHLGFQFRQEGTDDGAIPYVRYELTLRGYAPVQNNPNEIEVVTVDTNIMHYRVRHSKLTAEILSGNDPQFNKPKTKGKGFSVEDSGFTSITEADGNPTSPTQTYKINCKIFLYRGEGVSPAMFCTYENFFRDTIQQVWNSTTNNGLVSTYDPIGDFFNRDYIVDASGVQVFEATLKHFDRIDDGEVLLIVDIPAPNDSRSKIFKGNRTGQMFLDQNLSQPNPNNRYFENTQNTPAHEFGHILGLSDRYVYYAKVFTQLAPAPAPNLPPENHVGLNYVGRPPAIPQPLPPGVKQAYGMTAVYMPASEDIDYSKRYGWVNNLMSTQEIVPEFPDYDQNNAAPVPTDPLSRPIEAEFTYHEYNKHYRPNPRPTANRQIILDYSRITVFITKAQFDLILAPTLEVERSRRLFFKKNNGTNELYFLNYNGSFIGLRNGETVSDDKKDNQQDFRYIDVIDSNEFNLYDDKMEERLKNHSGTFNDPARDTIFGFVAPYDGNGKKFEEDPGFVNEGGSNPIDNISINGGAQGPADNYPDFITILTVAPDDIQMYDIEVGGIAYGDSGFAVAKQRTDFIRLFRLLSDPSAQIPANLTIANRFPGGINQFRQFIKNLFDVKHENLLHPPTAQDDKYKDYGESDANGKSIWNMSAPNDHNSNTAPYNTIFPQSATNQDSFGWRAYREQFIPITQALRNTIDVVNTNSMRGFNPIQKVYEMKYDYYYNRRNIILIMQTGN